MTHHEPHSAAVHLDNTPWTRESCLYIKHETFKKPTPKRPLVWLIGYSIPEIRPHHPEALHVPQVRCQPTRRVFPRRKVPRQIVPPAFKVPLGRMASFWAPIRLGAHSFGAQATRRPFGVVRHGPAAHVARQPLKTGPGTLGHLNACFYQ